METSAFQGRIKRLKEVNEVIRTLDPAIREQAFSLLSGYVTGEAEKNRKVGGDHFESDTAPAAPAAPTTELFSRFPDGKPSDNVVLIAASLYSQYGGQPFKLDEIREIAGSVGLTIPASIDMTLKQAKRDGKSLFQHTGRSEFRPTVHGELFFKNTYQVTKGVKKRAALNAEL